MDIIMLNVIPLCITLAVWFYTIILMILYSESNKTKIRSQLVVLRYFHYVIAIYWYFRMMLLL